MPHLLVIDELPEIQRYLELVLRYLGYEVAVAASLADAMALTPPLHPHAIILNLGYAYADPSTPLELLRTYLPGHPIPVIAISARADLRREDVCALGYADLIAKPFHLQTLLKCLEAALMQARALG